MDICVYNALSVDGGGVSIKRLLIVYGCLLLGLALTVGLRFLDYHSNWSTAGHLLLAFTMATLIFAQYMHLRSATPLTRLIALGVLAWLYIMFLLIFGDYLSR